MGAGCWLSSPTFPAAGEERVKRSSFFGSGTCNKDERRVFRVGDPWRVLKMWT